MDYPNVLPSDPHRFSHCERLGADYQTRLYYRLVLRGDARGFCPKHTLTVPHSSSKIIFVEGSAILEFFPGDVEDVGTREPRPQRLPHFITHAARYIMVLSHLRGGLSENAPAVVVHGVRVDVGASVKEESFALLGWNLGKKYAKDYKIFVVC